MGFRIETGKWMIRATGEDWLHVSTTRNRNFALLWCVAHPSPVEEVVLSSQWKQVSEMKENT